MSNRHLQLHMPLSEALSTHVHDCLFHWARRIMLAAITNRSKICNGSHHRSLFLTPLTVQGECLWLTGVSSLHPVVLPFLEAFSSFSSIQKKGRENLKRTCLPFKSLGPVMICTYVSCFHSFGLYSITWQHLTARETEKCIPAMFRRRDWFSATICPSSHRISALFFLHIKYTYSWRELTQNSILSFHPFQNSGFSGYVQSSHKLCELKASYLYPTPIRWVYG